MHVLRETHGPESLLLDGAREALIECFLHSERIDDARAELLGMLAARGMAEIVRVTRTLGGRAETLTGLAGFGDLMSAVAGDRRPEYALGEAVAKGLSPGEAQQTVKAHVEGAKIIDDLCAYASSRRLELPLVVALGGVLRGELSGEQAVEQLMSRAVGGEGL